MRIGSKSSILLFFPMKFLSGLCVFDISFLLALKPLCLLVVTFLPGLTSPLPWMSYWKGTDESLLVEESQGYLIKSWASLKIFQTKGLCLQQRLCRCCSKGWWSSHSWTCPCFLNNEMPILQLRLWLPKRNITFFSLLRKCGDQVIDFWPMVCKDSGLCSSQEASSMKSSLIFYAWSNMAA